jgi:hypothetical protein
MTFTFFQDQDDDLGLPKVYTKAKRKGKALQVRLSCFVKEKKTFSPFLLTTILLTLRFVSRMSRTGQMLP